MAALDPLIRSTLQQELKAIFQRLGKTVLIVTHDLGEAVFLAERVTLLHEGKVVQSGTFRDLLLTPADRIRHRVHQGPAHLARQRRSAMKAARWLGVLLAACLAPGAAAADNIVVGSKIFTEGYVLAEIAAQTLEASRPPVPVVRKLGMGSTGILFESLNSGAIDVYPDYTGTLAEAILKTPQLKSVAQIRAALLKMGIVISEPLGFNNTYALAVREDFAKR